jgi:SAM-dependent methyltransferase
MTSYAAMLYPAVNRVYADSSIRLLISELAVFDETVLGGVVSEFDETTIGGVPYITFTAPELTGDQVDLIANLSTLYALFAVEGELLRPVLLRKLDRFDSDLLTIQKYAGKTNELFTKLLLNATVLGTDRPGELTTERLRVLDPLCGRGTTLNQALMYGCHAAGLDTDGKDFDEYSRFIRTWLKNKRIKHQAEVTPIRRNKVSLGRRLDITLGVDKDSYKAGDTIEIAYVNGDTARCGEFFRANTFDALVTDLPYGVQHGSRGRGEQPLSRKPWDLLTGALPGWRTVLRPGGALGLSWNTNVAPREELADLLSDNGFTVLDSPGYRGFEHRVDQAIVRDLIVARKPA